MLRLATAPPFGGASVLLDTSVLASRDPRLRLPAVAAISTLSLAELSAGPHAAVADHLERGTRQERLQTVEASFVALPFDAACARAYGRVYSALAETGCRARGGRTLDLMIAATAVAHGLALLTRNARDLRGLERLLEVVDCSPGWSRATPTAE